MYAFIKGELFSANPLYVVISTGNIGYKIFIPSSSFGKLPQIGETLLLHTSYVVRELSQTLYGFLNAHETDLFDLLNSVTGIGPKLALNIISHLTIHELHKAIQGAQLNILTKIPGAGKKTAERMVIELRDKLTPLLPPDPNGLMLDLSHPKALKIQDAMNALINLGYNQSSAQTAIKKTIGQSEEDLDLGMLITHSLQHLKN